MDRDAAQVEAEGIDFPNIDKAVATHGGAHGGDGQRRARKGGAAQFDAVDPLTEAAGAADDGRFKLGIGAFAGGDGDVVAVDIDK
ncbi:MAG TPA: hypothetical protein VD994_05020 [Prosthecobacter sp.]|nr:hypothetical protein [Prosthecobacter sp.]